MKKMSLVLTLLLLCTFVSYSLAGEVRTWTGGSGSIEGEFVELIEKGTIVRIRIDKDTFMRVPLAKLSEEDQEYIKKIVDNPFEKEGKKLDSPFVLETSAPLKAGSKAGEREVRTIDGIEYAFRWCPPGEFMMGGDMTIDDIPDEWLGSSPYNDSIEVIREVKKNILKEHDDEKPIHRVKLTRGFWLLETEVTQAMWESMMGGHLSQFMCEQNPVEKVSWNYCQEFCRKLSQKLGQQVQLPTEAQWEYACRAGTTGDYAGPLDSMAWYSNNSGKETHPVGQKKPNAWGLYDMHGNVREWCSDYYDENYYSKSPTSDPENTATSPNRVVRGGSWESSTESTRSADRGGLELGYRSGNLGLRVLLVPDPEE